MLRRPVEPAQFRSRKYLAALRRHDLTGSMGQVASAGDNAAMESFFALLQNNVLDRRRWHTRHDLSIAIVTWIERTYHRRRRQARLGRLTHRFRDHHDHTGPTGRPTQPVTKTCSSPDPPVGGLTRHAQLRAMWAIGRPAATPVNHQASPNRESGSSAGHEGLPA